MRSKVLVENVLDLPTFMARGRGGPSLAGGASYGSPTGWLAARQTGDEHGWTSRLFGCSLVLWNPLTLDEDEFRRHYRLDYRAFRT